MPAPDRPVVRAKGFQKPPLESKESAKKAAPSQPEVAVTPPVVCEPEPIVAKVAIEQAAPPEVTEVAIETPLTVDVQAPAPTAATGGVRVSHGFSKDSNVSAAPVQPRATTQAVAAGYQPSAYQPDTDPGRVSRRQWWKYHLYVRSGRQAMEHPAS